MKRVRIIKMAEGGVNTPDPYPKKGNLKDWFDRLRAKGYKGKLDVGEMQKWMVKNHPDDVLEYMNQNPPSMNTNKGKKLFGKDWNSYTDEQKLEAFNDDKWWFRDPVPKDDTPGLGLNKRTSFPGDDLQAAGDNPGNTYGYKEPGTEDKERYNKRKLPFYQIAPEMMGIAESFQPFDYQTPDFTHWEVNPATLNIQPQLNDVNASLRSFYDSTTGNPQVDNIRRQAAFVAGLDAKSKAFGAKQNFDANARFNADVTNLNARTAEQNADVEAWTKIRNDYLAPAKDFAAGERISALSSIVRKKALNAKNENEKAFYYDNFAPNVDENDGMLDATGTPTFFEKYYPADKPASNEVKPTIKTAPSANPPSLEDEDYLDPSVIYGKMGMYVRRKRLY